jgi:hypothetical protein
VRRAEIVLATADGLGTDQQQISRVLWRTSRSTAAGMEARHVSRLPSQADVQEKIRVWRDKLDESSHPVCRRPADQSRNELRKPCTVTPGVHVPQQHADVGEWLAALDVGEHELVDPSRGQLLDYGHNPIAQRHLVGFVSLHACGGDPPHLGGQVKLIEAGTKGLFGSERGQDGHLERSRGYAVLGPEPANELRHVLVGQRGMVARRCNLGALWEKVFVALLAGWVCPPAVVIGSGGGNDGLDAAPHPARRLRFAQPDGLVSAARRTRLIGANQLLLRAEIEPIGCFIFDVAGGGLPRKPFPDQSFLGAGARRQLVGRHLPAFTQRIEQAQPVSKKHRCADRGSHRDRPASSQGMHSKLATSAPP